MISTHGNNLFFIIFVVVLLSLSSFMCIKLRQARTELSKNAKKYELAELKLRENNKKVVEGQDL